MTAIAIFDPGADLTHAPDDDDPSYQESALFVWHDLATGLGGFWRLGQEPVVAQLNSCFGLFTADGMRFRSNVTGAAMAPGDRGEAHMGWGPHLRLDLDGLAIAADFPDCEARLRFEDFFPRYDWADLIGMPGSSDHMKAHFEVAGRMTGEVRIGERTMTVDALAYRDRSWGPRRWGTLRSTRWWPCVFGPDLCVQGVTMLDENGRHAGLGYMIRDGVPCRLRDLDSIAAIDYDGLSPRSAWGRFGYGESGEGELHHDPADGIVMHVRGYTAVESIGTVRWGERVGMSNFEINTNPAGGDRPPAAAFRANMTDGLSRRAPAGARS